MATPKVNPNPENPDPIKPPLEISKSVLLDITNTTLDGIEGLDLAATAINVGEVLRNQPGSRRPRALKVSREGQQVTVDIGVNIEFGKNLVKLSQQAQRAVQENIELMTGLKVKAVNITVQGVGLPRASEAVNPSTKAQAAR